MIFKNGKRNLDGFAEKEFLEKKGYETDWQQLCSKFHAVGHRVVTIMMNMKKDFKPIFGFMGEVLDLGTTQNSRFVTENSMALLLRLIGAKTAIKQMFWSLQQAENNGDDGIEEEEEEEEDKTKNTSMSMDQMLELTMARSDTITPYCVLNMRTILKSTSPEIVLEVFASLLTPENVMSLTTNEIFGKFWRRINGQIKAIKKDDSAANGEGKYDKQVQQLCDCMSRLIRILPKADSDCLRVWIENSYNEISRIRELQEANWKNAKSFLFLPIAPGLDYKEVLEVTRGATNFKQINRFISMIDLETAEKTDPFPHDDDEEAADCIPLSLSSHSALFGMMAHLISPGVFFSKRGALILAAFALRNKLLASRADMFLTENKGKWINWETKKDNSPVAPLNWSPGFIRVLHLLDSKKHLTTKEIAFRDKFSQICSLRSNARATVTLNTGNVKPGNLMKGGADYRLMCEQCNLPRSFTVMAAAAQGTKSTEATTTPKTTRKFGICISYHADDDPETVTGRKDGKADWASCTRCKSCYMVTNTKALNVRTKCHFCRLGMTGRGQKKYPPHVQCSRCKLRFTSESRELALEAMRDFFEDNKFVAVGATAPTASSTGGGRGGGGEDSGKDVKQLASVTATRKTIAKKVLERLEGAVSKSEFLCPHCATAPTNAIAEKEIEIREILEENPSLKCMLPVGPYDNIVANQKLIRIITTVRTVSPEEQKKGREAARTAEITVGGVTVLQPEKLRDSVLKQLIHGSGRAECGMCFEEVPVSMIGPMCGHCPNRFCQNCAEAWYGNVKIGHIVARAHAVCPCCKATPKYRVMRRASKVLISIRNRAKYDWDAKYHHALCSKCLRLSKVVARECARAPPTLDAFVCLSCKEEAEEKRDKVFMAKLKAMKTCPACKTRTEKIDGCNHISCPCSEHWCYACGEGFGSDVESVYEHMDIEHGGIYYNND